MKRLVVLVALFLCLLPCPARGEELTSGISKALAAPVLASLLGKLLELAP